MTESDAAVAAVAGTIRLAYVVTRWLLIDRFPHLHAESRAGGLALPPIVVRWQSSDDFRHCGIRPIRPRSRGLSRHAGVPLARVGYFVAGQQHALTLRRRALDLNVKFFALAGAPEVVALR